MTIVIYLLAFYSLINAFDAFHPSFNRKVNLHAQNRKFKDNKNSRLLNINSPHLRLQMTNNEEDEDDLEFLSRVKNNYLVNKFKDCRGEDCRATCSRDEIQTLLLSILPPLTPEDLAAETNRIISKFPQPDLISADDFVRAASENSFWKRAGSLVVKELIFLDCLNSYYYDKQTMLNDEVGVAVVYY